MKGKEIEWKHNGVLFLCWFFLFLLSEVSAVSNFKVVATNGIQ